MISKVFLFALLLAPTFVANATANAQNISIIPQPVKMNVEPGVFTITPETLIYADTASYSTGRQLADYLAPATGFALRVLPLKGQVSLDNIIIAEDPGLAGIGNEGYRLMIKPREMRISSAGQAGLFYGIQTLRQLLPPQIFSKSPVGDISWSVPCVTIEDRPRFAWRGLMLDSGHDFQRLEFVRRFLDLMAEHKLNLFHWHLTDVGTWSVEIKGRPELIAPATRGKGVKTGFYSQDDIREVVRYAAERHITILPEIDMPGHETPALLAYPDLECPVPRGLDRHGNPARPYEFCVGNAKTDAFLEEVLGQIIELFPGKFIHIGGDECPKQHWLRCRFCQAKMKAAHLANGEELQSDFIRHIGKFLQSKGRRLIGWDEILEGGLAPDATVMSWRGMEGGIAAAREDHDVVMAPAHWTYFDYPSTTVEKVYSFEPVPPGLSASQAVHVLGAQAQMWTDGHPTEERIETLVYPRAAALAEVVWSPATGRDYDGFMKRLQIHVTRLTAQGVRLGPLRKRPVPAGPVIGRWAEDKIIYPEKSMEWPIDRSLIGTGIYEITFQYERGSSAYHISNVEIVQDGKVVAMDKHLGMTGAHDSENVYRFGLWKLADSPLTLRAKVRTDRETSYGRIVIEKDP
jgi:hexosaminidase